MTYRQAAISLEYVRVPVGATFSGVAQDPTGDTVKMAFMTDSTSPGNSDWQTASWETDGSTYYACCLVGPGGTVTLAAGDYRIWVKVTDSPEVPAKRAGMVTVF